MVLGGQARLNSGAVGPVGGSVAESASGCRGAGPTVLEPSGHDAP